MPFFK